MMKAKTIYGLALGPVVLLTLVFVARVIHGAFLSEAFAISLLIGTAGVAIGWLIGFLTSPYTRKEEKKFTTYSSGLVGLVSGYLFSKVIDPGLTMLFKDGGVLENTIYGVNFLIFMIAAIVSTIGGYSFRAYIHNSTFPSGVRQGEQDSLVDQV